jgi:RNA polymerase sigma factor (TIGR02999 family)
MNGITELIRALNAGDADSLDRLFHLLYADLRQVAHSRLRRSEGPAPLDTTALVNESYLRFVQLRELRVEDRGHFLSYAARVMRSVVVDMVRESRADRRGGGVTPVTLDTSLAGAQVAGEEEILAVHSALDELAVIDQRLAQIVEMRYYVGLEMSEIAEVLGVGKRTVERDWEKARSFLYRALRPAAPSL